MGAAPVIRLDISSSVPAYRQIADGLRSQLVSGALAAGSLLPTVRELGLDLGVHHNTVAEAYRTLAAEGWLDLTRRRGATVLQRPTPAPTPDIEGRYLDRLRSVVAEARAAGVPAPVLIAEFKRLLENGPLR